MGEVKKLNTVMSDLRTERYALQSVARLAIPSERVAKCLRLVNNKTNVQVWKHLETQKAFYNGLLVCGSVWNCPVCSAKITEKRRKELKKAVDLWTEEGKKIAFLTLTFSHTKNDGLKDILNKFTESIRRFKSGRAFQNIKKEMGIFGTIRALEVTYGKNGFHPHVHELIFYENEIDLKIIEDKLKKIWLDRLTKESLKANYEHGLTLQDGKKANDYLTKQGKSDWSIDKEMTKYHIKKGKDINSLHPYDFLRLYLNNEDKKYLELFKEYALAFKHKRQLFWSRGLKNYFNIEDKSDEELAKEKTEMADLLGLLTYNEWKIILKNDLRTKFLDYVEKYGFIKAKKQLIKKSTKKENLIL